MYYVYLLRSVNYPEQIYVGYTQDFEKRFSDHHSGKSSHTAKYKHWGIEVVIGFKSKLMAVEFEIYLKSHSGRAFAAKRFFANKRS